MNLWTPIAAVSVAALALSIGCVVEKEGPRPAAPGGAAACNNQPNMAAALRDLREGRSYLDRAEHNKGGWRDAAIAAADSAIRETDRGCAFADTH